MVISTVVEQVDDPQLLHLQKAIYAMEVAVTDDVTVVPVAEHFITVLYASVEQSVLGRIMRGVAAEKVPDVVTVVVVVVTVQRRSCMWL